MQTAYWLVSERDSVVPSHGYPIVLGHRLSCRPQWAHSIPVPSSQSGRSILDQIEIATQIQMHAWLN